jgi:hypothetical protein
VTGLSNRGPEGRALFALAAAVALLSSPRAEARTAAEAGAANMRIAMDICLTNYRTQAQIPDALRRTGFTLTEGIDPGVWEFSGPRVNGFVAPSDSGGGACQVESTAVPRAQGEAVGRALAARYFAGVLQEGPPEGRADCPTISIFAPRLLLVMEFLNPGNGGICSQADGAAIYLRM